MPVALKSMTAEDIANILAGRSPVARTVDAEGVAWIWAGHPDPWQELGDGTAECEYLVQIGILAPRVVDDCECGCVCGRCYVYRVIKP
jgi:hypothetical protein